MCLQDFAWATSLESKISLQKKIYNPELIFEVKISVKFDTLHHHHIILYFKVFGPNFLLNYFACTVSFTTKHQRTSKSNTTHFFWVKLKFKCESAYMDGTTTNSDPSVRWCHRAHIDSNVSSDTFSCVIIRSKVGNLYFHSWLVSIHGHGPMTIYKRCQILSSFWQQQHRMDVHLCDWSVTYCKHFLWSYYKSDLAKKDLNFAIPVRLPMFVKKILSSSS